MWTFGLRISRLESNREDEAGTHSSASQWRARPEHVVRQMQKAGSVQGAWFKVHGSKFRVEGTSSSAAHSRERSSNSLSMNAANEYLIGEKYLIQSRYTGIPVRGCTRGYGPGGRGGGEIWGEARMHLD